MAAILAGLAAIGAALLIGQVDRLKPALQPLPSKRNGKRRSARS